MLWQLRPMCAFSLWERMKLGPGRVARLAKCFPILCGTFPEAAKFEDREDGSETPQGRCAAGAEFH